MTSNANRPEETPIHELMQTLGRAAVAAAGQLARTDTRTKDLALSTAAAALRSHSGLILAANAEDLRCAPADLSAALRDRLRLDATRVEAMAAGLEAIVALQDPIGSVMAQWTRPNGLQISRVRVPLGVPRDVPTLDPKATLL